MPEAQMIGRGVILTAWRARFSGRRLPIAAPVVPVDPPVVPGIRLPDMWNSIHTPAAGYVGPLIVQVLLASGGSAVFDAGALRIGGGAVLIGAAGKVFAFSSMGSMNMWAAIARARALREVELAEAMTAESRAAWLVKKRAALEKAAKNRINAAARQSDPAIVAALVADAEFALVKWAHYA